MYSGQTLQLIEALYLNLSFSERCTVADTVNVIKIRFHEIVEKIEHILQCFKTGHDNLLPNLYLATIHDHPILFDAI
jgi:hypothetical protein